MTPLLIYGSGGHARETLELVRCLNGQSPAFEVLGWIDDDPARQGTEQSDLPILSRDAAIRGLPAGGQVVVALGSPSARHRAARWLADVRIDSPVLVHPRAWVGSSVELGPGSQVAAGAMVSTDVRIGRHVIVNQGTTVAHDVDLADFVTLAPGVRLSGAVSVGDGADVGTAAVVIQGRRIGDWSIVGAGALVIRDVPPDTTVEGVPAKIVAQRTRGWHRGGDEPSLTDS